MKVGSWSGRDIRVWGVSLIWFGVAEVAMEEVGGGVGGR